MDATLSRSEQVDLIVLEMRKAWEAGISPPPQELMLAAVEARVAQAHSLEKDFTSLEKDFTLPMLGQYECLAGPGSGMHTLFRDLGARHGYLQDRGLFGRIPKMEILPSRRGGPVAEDDIGENVVPGSLFVVSVCPILDASYDVFRVSYVTTEEGEKATALFKDRPAYDTAAGFCKDYPAISPMFLLGMLTEGIGRIVTRLLRLANEAERVASAMNVQDTNIRRFIEEVPPQGGTR